MKGYISADNVANVDDKTEYRITMRVPSESFEILLDRISQHAKNWIVKIYMFQTLQQNTLTRNQESKPKRN